MVAQIVWSREEGWRDSSNIEWLPRRALGWNRWWSWGTCVACSRCSPFRVSSRCLCICAMVVVRLSVREGNGVRFGSELKRSTADASGMCCGSHGGFPVCAPLGGFPTPLPDWCPRSPLGPWFCSGGLIFVGRVDRLFLGGLWGSVCPGCVVSLGLCCPATWSRNCGLSGPRALVACGWSARGGLSVW
jgi:hypothetical protein